MDVKKVACNTPASALRYVQLASLNPGNITQDLLPRYSFFQSNFYKNFWKAKMNKCLPTASKQGRF